MLRAIHLGQWPDGLREALERMREMQAELQADLHIAPGWNVVERRRPRRLAGRADAYYAELAQAYVGLAATDRHPVATLSIRRRAKRAHVRDWLREARDRGTLSPGLPGRP